MTRLSRDPMLRKLCTTWTSCHTRHTLCKAEDDISPVHMYRPFDLYFPKRLPLTALGKPRTDQQKASLLTRKYGSCLCWPRLGVVVWGQGQGNWWQADTEGREGPMPRWGNVPSAQMACHEYVSWGTEKPSRKATTNWCGLLGSSWANGVVSTVSKSCPRLHCS